MSAVRESVFKNSTVSFDLISPSTAVVPWVFIVEIINTALHHHYPLQKIIFSSVSHSSNSSMCHHTHTHHFTLLIIIILILILINTSCMEMQEQQALSQLQMNTDCNCLHSISAHFSFPPSFTPPN